MWSKFYFFKKNYGKLFALIYFFPIFLRIIIRVLFYKIIKNQIKKEKYLLRLDALSNSIKGSKSFKRLNDT